VNWTQLVLIAVWWFNPVVWLLSRALRRTREDCCDDLVLSRKLTTPDAYCETLLRAAAELSAPMPLSAVLGFAERLHPLANRLRRIMDGTIRRSGRLSFVGLLAVVAVAIFLLPGLPNAQREEEKGTAEKSVEAVDPQAILDKNLAQYTRLSNGVIRCIETSHHRADMYPEESARVDISSSVRRYRVPYTAEAIQEWIESRRKPYSQTYETTLSFCGDVYRCDTKTDPGLFYPHGCDFSQIWDANKYILIDRLAKGVSIYDLQSFKSLLYDVYPHPKLLMNVPAFFLTSSDWDGASHEFVSSPVDASKHAVRILREGRFVAQADLFSEGFIGFRNAQYSDDGRSIANIHSEGSFQDISGVPLFPKRIRIFRSARSEEERENPNIGPDLLWQFIQSPSHGDDYTDFVVESAVLNIADMTERDLYPTIPKGWNYWDNRAGIRAKRTREGMDPYVYGETQDEIPLAESPTAIPETPVAVPTPRG